MSSADRQLPLRGRTYWRGPGDGYAHRPLAPCGRHLRLQRDRSPTTSRCSSGSSARPSPSAGVELTAETYFAELAGHSDPEIVERALELGGVEPTAERCETSSCGERSTATRRRSPRADRQRRRRRLRPQRWPPRVPVAIASGAVREEVELVLELAGLLEDSFARSSCIDDVDARQARPGGLPARARAAQRGARRSHESIVARDVLAIEDSRVRRRSRRPRTPRASAARPLVAGDERAEAAADFSSRGRSQRAAASERLLDPLAGAALRASDQGRGGDAAEGRSRR